MNDITVLRSIKQLEGKTVTLITHSRNLHDTFRLYFTKCRSILVEVLSVGHSLGESVAKVSYIKDIVEIYKEFGDKLVSLMIITQEDSIELNSRLDNWLKSENKEEYERELRLELATYARLKRKFEVDYKL